MNHPAVLSPPPGPVWGTTTPGPVPRRIRPGTVVVIAVLCAAVTAAAVWFVLALRGQSDPAAQSCGRERGRAGAADLADCFGDAIAARDADAMCELSTARLRKAAAAAALGGPETCEAATRRVLALGDATAANRAAVDAWGRSFRDSPVTVEGDHAYVTVRRASGPTRERLTYEDGHWRLDFTDGDPRSVS